MNDRALEYRKLLVAIDAICIDCTGAGDETDKTCSNCLIRKTADKISAKLNNKSGHKNETLGNTYIMGNVWRS